MNQNEELLCLIASACRWAFCLWLLIISVWIAAGMPE